MPAARFWPPYGFGFTNGGWFDAELADERGDVDEGEDAFQNGAGASSR